MNRIMFHKLLDRTMYLLDQYKAVNSKVLAKANSTKVEELALECVKNAVEDLKIAPEISAIKYKKGGHSFPDIIICANNGEKYGIEVKSSTDKKKSWRLSGNSAKGETLERGLLEIYIIICKTPLEVQEFRCREYSECVKSIDADHSPRYQLDMELPKGSSFFDAMGVPFDKFIYDDDPIQMVQKYYGEVGKKAWWLPPTLDCLSDLPEERRVELISYGMVYYTEIFSRGNKKYYRLSNWLATEQSVLALNLRDYYSGSGKVNIVTKKRSYSQLPHFFMVILENKETILKTLDMANAKELMEYWHYCTNQPRNTVCSKKQAWIEEVSENIKANKDVMKKLREVGLTDPKEILEDIFE